MTRQQRSTLQAAAPFIAYYKRNQCLPTTAPNVQAVLQNAYRAFNPTTTPIDFSCRECVKQGIVHLMHHLEQLNPPTVK